jgi:hypothetical protein
VSVVPIALHASKNAKGNESDLCAVTVSDAPDATPLASPATPLASPAVLASGVSALAPYEYEDVTELRRKLQVPQLIENTVVF